MREVFAPHLGRPVKLGRLVPKPRPQMLRFGDYVSPDLPDPPDSCSYLAGGGPAMSNIFMNDQLGDCVIAAGAHFTAMATGNSGDQFTYSDDQILADYEAIGGYKPGDPSTDQGCDEVTAFEYWQSHGFADGTKLGGHLLIDATNQKEVKQALNIFESLFFGVGLPSTWVSPFPSSGGFVWDVGIPNANNGHAFMGVDYSDQGVQIDTWGLIGTITWAAVAALCGGADGGQLYALLTPDVIGRASIESPIGLDWDQIEADFAALSGRGGMTGR